MNQKTMTITFDVESLASTEKFVTFHCDTMPIPFWQMVVGEVVRQLEDLRKASAAMALHNKMIEEQKNMEIAAMLAGKGNSTRFGPG